MWNICEYKLNVHFYIRDILEENDFRPEYRLSHGRDNICRLSTLSRVVVLSPNLRRGIKQNFVAKSGILGFLIVFGRFLYEKKY